jgi:hypothetical protein
MVPPDTVTSAAVKVLPTLCEKLTEKGMGAVLVGLAEVVLTVAVRAGAVTLNVLVSVCAQGVVTTRLPGPNGAVFGTTKVKPVLLRLLTVAAAPFTVTLLTPLRLVPATVTGVPRWAEVGLTLLIVAVGDGFTVTWATEVLVPALLVTVSSTYWVLPASVQV